MQHATCPKCGTQMIPAKLFVKDGWTVRDYARQVFDRVQMAGCLSCFVFPFLIPFIPFIAIGCACLGLSAWLWNASDVSLGEITPIDVLPHAPLSAKVFLGLVLVSFLVGCFFALRRFIRGKAVSGYRCPQCGLAFQIAPKAPVKLFEQVVEDGNGTKDYSEKPQYKPFFSDLVD